MWFAAEGAKKGEMEKEEEEEEQQGESEADPGERQGTAIKMSRRAEIGRHRDVYSR